MAAAAYNRPPLARSVSALRTVLAVAAGRVARPLLRVTGRLRRVALLLGLLIASPASGQTAWRLVADGQDDPSWSASTAWTADSLRPAARSALAHLHALGYVAARLDSASVESDTVRLYASLGRRYGLRRIAFEGLARMPEAEARSALALDENQPLPDTTLAAALVRLARAYSAQGLPLAQVRIAALDTLGGGYALTVGVDEGAETVLARIELPKRTRTRPALVAQIAGLAPGRPLRHFDAEAAAARLRASGYFRRVGAVRLELDSVGALVAVLPVEEEPPGAFDLVLGLLPPTASGEKAQLMGTGSLTLRNLAGLGYDLAVRLNRLPGRVANASARAATPQLLGLPLRLDVRFDGLQQDSTLAQQRYRAEAAYRIGALDLVALVTSERTQPGDAGREIVGRAQRIARADALYLGGGLRYRTLDDAVNPRRGLAFDALVETGRAVRSRLAYPAEIASPTPADTLVRERTATRQDRLTASGRAFVPTLPRQTLVVGGDAWLLRSPAPDEADLFRIGGATTLRGYDEEQFRAQAAARAVVEYRYRLDRVSYAYVFADLGYVDQPAVGGAAPLHGVRPGYGLGVQVDTPAGIVLVTYAASPETGLAAGRVHLGLSFGL